ncbi:MAG: peptidylprolyl isomerase, partial [Planctomycetota bacterium]
GPNGLVKAEFSRDPARAHRYGVLSMARSTPPDSASSQYFIITDSEAPSVKNLDGQYTSFGIMHHGVAVLEQLADIPTTPNMRGEKSNPTRRAVITEVRVKRGTPAIEAEEIKRPPFDLKGEPERVRIQHVLISFAGTRTAATRSKEEAQKLAEEILQRAKDGEDFDSLILNNTDDPGSMQTTPPGGYSMLNTRQGAPDRTPEQEAEIADLNKQMEEHLAALRAEVNAKTKSIEEAQKELQSHPAMAKLQEYSWTPRDQLVPAFGDVGFSLKVGEVGIANFDPEASPFGWHIIRRYE